MSIKPRHARPAVPRCQLSLLMALSLSATLAQAAESPDLSRWKCRYCLQPELQQARIELGIGSADSALYHPQAYRAIDQEGSYPLAGLQWQGRGASGHHFSLSGRDLGLDSRQIQFSAGSNGLLRLSLDYRNIPRLLNDGVQTPFTLSGDDLRLPGGWQRGGSTSEMSALNSSSSRVQTLRRDNTHWRAALHFTPNRHWDLRVRLHHQQVDGDKVQGGSFATKASLLPYSIDWNTDELELLAAYVTPTAQTQVAYLISQFRNTASGLRWDNPYNAIRDGVDHGRLAQPPDNDWHRLAVSQHWRPASRLRMHLQLTAGQASQDQAFLPATENPNIHVTQPGDSLDGQLNQRGGKFGLSYQAHRSLRIKARYLLDDRDNRTPIALWQPVLTDVEELQPRANRPYSFRREQGRISMHLRPQGHWRINAGLQTEERDREMQLIESTQTDSAWLELARRQTGGSGISLRLSGSERDSAQEAGSQGSLPAPENPRMRQYHLADRTRQKLALRWQGQPFPAWHASLQIGLASDDYANSPIGLQFSESWNGTISLAWSPADSPLRLSSFASLQRIEAELLNSANDSVADWRSQSRDSVLAYGLSLQHPQLLGRLGLGLDYQASASQGDLHVDAGNARPDFPRLNARMQMLQAHLEYPLRANLRLRLGYWLERYSGDDWATDGVDEDSISNVLGLGQTMNDGQIDVLSLALRLDL